MRRRKFLGVAAAAALAGCNGFLEGDQTPTPEPTRTEPYELAIDYDGPWNAELAIGRDGGTERRDIDGNGSDRLTIPAEAHRLEAWVEQRDNRFGVLEIRLLDGEDVIVRSSIGDDGSETGIDTPL